MALALNNNVVLRQFTRFTGTGAIQNFTVPQGVYAIRFFMWGAGGGNQSGSGTIVNGSGGGSGAYLEGTIQTTPGQVLQIIVGQIGLTTLASGGGGSTSFGGGGGGFSGIFSGSPAANTVIAIAGGGGGCCANGRGNGGGGGFPNGSSGTGLTAGGGGTQTTGGTAGGNGFPGSQLQGGNAGNVNDGGGGGGWYGGGGAGNFNGGGGGGSSTYISSVLNPVSMNGSQGITTTGSNTPAPNESSIYWISPAGRSAASGLVVFGYSAVEPQMTFNPFNILGANTTTTLSSSTAPSIVASFTTVGIRSCVILGSFTSYDILIVGGGGGGGGEGGGGAGGLVSQTNVTLAQGAYTLVVGNGGGGGSNGGNSSFLTFTAIGGGTQSTVGGCGGGGNGNPTTAGGTGLQGGRGGNGTNQNVAGGGGGGMGGDGGGTNGGAGRNAGIGGYNGGPGVQNSITGTAVFYAGGGGGMGTNAAGGLGGSGGGGNGGQNAVGVAGTNGLGGGGGNGASGGSGIVIIRGYLPIVAPITRAITIWQPTQVPNLISWLDAANPFPANARNTIVMSGPFVSTWLDKTSNAYNFTSSGGVTLGTGVSRRSIFCGGSLSSGSLPITYNQTTVFLVCLPTVIGGENFSYIISQGIADFALRIGNGVFNNPGNTNDWGNDPATNTNSTIVNGTSIAVSSPNILGKTTIISSTVGKSFTGAQINGTFNGRVFNGHMFEVLFYSSVPTTAQRQEIEGYLAWKWNIVGNLPANHPYKNNPP